MSGNRKKKLLKTEVLLLKNRKVWRLRNIFLKKNITLKNNMFKKLVKDKNLRKRYNSFETWNRLNKSFKKSLLFYNIPKTAYKGKKKYSKVSIRNYCFKTGRSSGVLPFFRISRMVFREEVGKGLFVGVYK